MTEVMFDALTLAGSVVASIVKLIALSLSP